MNKRDPIREQELADVEAVLNLPAGRRFYKRMLALSNALGASYTYGDTHATAFNEGLRRMGISLLNDAGQACPKLLHELLSNENLPEVIIDEWKC